MSEEENAVIPKELPEGEYTLTDGCAWLTAGPFSVRIFTAGDGSINICIYELGHETDTELDCAMVHPSQLPDHNQEEVEA